MKKQKKGFTLAELLIVVAIIAVLVAISIPIFSSQLKKARRAVDQANVRSAKAAAAAEYMTDGETGDVSYIYLGSKAIQLDSSDNVSIDASKGYGKSEGKDNLNNETGASGIPKNGYVEVTIHDPDNSNTSEQITASWVSSAAGAKVAATGNYSLGGSLYRERLTDELSKMGVDPKSVTSFTAEKGSTIKETVEGDGKGSRDNHGVLVDTFKDYPNLKSIDLSKATLNDGNINLFRSLPKSVEQITLPSSNTAYDIRGTWYYAGGEQVPHPSNNLSGADTKTDSRIETGHEGVTIYRTKEAAEAAKKGSGN